MKRNIFLTLAAALMMCFAACTKDNPTTDNGNQNSGNGDNTSSQLVGNWKVDNLTVNGRENTPENLVIEMYANGTGLLNDNGETENNGFDWSVSGNTLTIRPRNGEATYTIVSISATECTLSGNTVPGTDIQGDVTMHLVKINGGGDQPDPDPEPVPDPDHFPAGTQWQFIYDTSIVESDPDAGSSMDMQMAMDLTITFANSGNGGRMAVNMISSGSMTIGGQTYPIGEDEEVHETAPFTYTYDDAAQQGVITATGTDEETGRSETTTLPFRYVAADNTIVIDVPEEQQSDFGPRQYVFHRIN